MSSANKMNDLKRWAILNVLDSELMDQVRIALVFGNSSNRAIFVTKDDKVYAFGNNTGGCLGIALDVSTFVPIEVESLSGKGVIKFASGSNVLALTKLGEVYCCNRSNYTPLPVLLGEKVIDVACGQHHFLALTDRGEVYIWGQIKDKEQKLTTIQPTKLITQFEDDNIISITSELNSILALTKTGLVYQWYPSTDSIDHMPQPVEILIDIVKLASGYDHTLALSTEGSLYIWGSNTYGQFGNGNVIRSLMPYKVLSQLVGHIVDIAAGKDISAAVNKRGQVYMWGYCCAQKISIPTSVPVSNVDDVILYFSSSNVMRESREFHQERGTSLLECLKQNFDNSVTGDLEIKVQDRTIHVHKAILKLRSSHFDRMFNGDWKETNESIIVQKQYSYDVYKAFLLYLYTGNIAAPPDQVLELKKLANQYLDTELGELCDRIILKNKKQESSTSNVYELKKWPILNLIRTELIVQVRTAFVFGPSGNEAIIITNDDKVYGFGTNENGCLGIGIRSSTLNATEIEVLSGKGVVKLGVGYMNIAPHVLALTGTGQVYSWGRNECGQLGIGTRDNQWTPIQIKHELSDQKVIDIACGSLMSLALTDEGKVYQWGYESINSCTLRPTHKPSALFNDENIKSIACMAFLNTAITESGEIYCWGHDYNPSTKAFEAGRFKTPEKIGGLGNFDLVKIVAGWYHLLALSEEGAIYIWGRNINGQLCCGDISGGWSSYKMPMHMMGPIVDMAAGLDMSAAINQKGEVFMWGQCQGEDILIPIRTELTKLSDVLLYFATLSIMHQQLELPEEEKTNVLEFLEHKFDDPITCDLIVQVQDKPIHVHKIILQLRSSYCERMLKEYWVGQNLIKIQDPHSYEVYVSFFKYLYTDKVDVAPANLNELLDLAHRYSVPCLINLCNQLIEKNYKNKHRYFISYSHLI